MNGETRSGLLLGVGAYAIWGILPLYLRLLHGVPATQILAHRVVWSLVLLAVVVVAMKRARGIVEALRSGRTAMLLCASAALIAINWLVYIWAVGNGHVLEASLGYFITPLVNVGLAMAVLGETLRPGQAVAIAVAGIGVLVMVVAGGGAVWIPLSLAVSFGTYGLIRKIVAIDALGGLTIETLLLAPFCAALLGLAGSNGAFGHDRALDALLILAGLVTAAPLLMFAAAARKLRYTTMGLLQFIAPTLQFLSAVFVFGEALRPIHLLTFGLIWAGCALYALDNLRGERAEAVA